MQCPCQSYGANCIHDIILWYTCKSSSKSQSIQSLLMSMVPCLEDTNDLALIQLRQLKTPSTNCNQHVLILSLPAVCFTTSPYFIFHDYLLLSPQSFWLFCYQQIILCCFFFVFLPQTLSISLYLYFSFPPFPSSLCTLSISIFFCLIFFFF